MSRHASGPASSPNGDDLLPAGAYDAAGVDVTLVDWMLSLSPRERLEALFVHATSIARLLADARTD